MSRSPDVVCADGPKKSVCYNTTVENEIVAKNIAKDKFYVIIMPVNWRTTTITTIGYAGANSFVV